MDGWAKGQKSASDYLNEVLYIENFLKSKLSHVLSHENSAKPADIEKIRSLLNEVRSVKENLMGVRPERSSIRQVTPWIRKLSRTEPRRVEMRDDFKRHRTIDRVLELMRKLRGGDDHVTAGSHLNMPVRKFSGEDGVERDVSTRIEKPNFGVENLFRSFPVKNADDFVDLSRLESSAQALQGPKVDFTVESGDLPTMKRVQIPVETYSRQVF